MRGLRKKPQPPDEPTWVSVITMATEMYERTGDEAYQQFKQMVLMHVADQDDAGDGFAELQGIIAEAQHAATRQPTPAEGVAAKVGALITAFAARELDTQAALLIGEQAALYVARFNEFCQVAGPPQVDSDEQVETRDK
jgi:hypothetical protein